MPAMQRGQREDEELVGLDPIAEEARARFGVAHGDQHLAELRRDDGAAEQQAERQRDAPRATNSAARVACGLHVEAQDVLEIGEAVIAAEAQVVAEEGEQQRKGHRLGDDREIDAGDPAAEREPAEDEGEKRPAPATTMIAANAKHVEAVPVPGQFLPVQEHHEVGQDRIAVDAAAADLAHQIHAHGIAAEREEGAMAKREDAAIAPDQIDRRARAARSRRTCRTARPDRSACAAATSRHVQQIEQRHARPPAAASTSDRDDRAAIEGPARAGIMPPPPCP